jgi:hypothetical protein
MKVLIACEESQTVCKAFRDRGHEAYSCDIQECSGGHPEWHFMQDVFEVINGGGWDLMIAHPPCTYLTVTANRAMAEDRRSLFPVREQWRNEALDFVQKLMDCGIPKIAIENPVGVISTRIRKPDQIIQPYEYGYPETKKTCLWLTNLPKLVPTKIVTPEFIICRGKKYSPTHYKNGGNAKVRSKTYEGIAKAMAEQWG